MPKQELPTNGERRANGVSLSEVSKEVSDFLRGNPMKGLRRLVFLSGPDFKTSAPATSQ